MSKKKERYGNTREKILAYDKQLRKKLTNLSETLDNLNEEITKIKSYYERTFHKDLTKKLTGFIGLGSLIISCYFLTPNFTGNSIANLNIGSTNLGGILLFLFGLLNLFIYSKK